MDEEITQRQNPELPLFDDTQELFAVPGVMTKWLLSFSNETLALSFRFLFGNVKSPGGFWEIWDKGKPQERDWQGDDTTHDIKPLPALFAIDTVESTVGACLKISTEHARQSCCAVEQSNAFASLLFRIPAADEVLSSSSVL